MRNAIEFRPTNMTALPTKLETLAIHGGSPVRAKMLPYGRQSLEDSDIEAVVEVLKSDWLTTGPKVGEDNGGPGS